MNEQKYVNENSMIIRARKELSLLSKEILNLQNNMEDLAKKKRNLCNNHLNWSWDPSRNIYKEISNITNQVRGLSMRIRDLKRERNELRKETKEAISWLVKAGWIES